MYILLWSMGDTTSQRLSYTNLAREKGLFHPLKVYATLMQHTGNGWNDWYCFMHL